MLKNIIAIAALLVTTNVLATNDLTIEKLATNKETKASFSKIVKDNHFPSWILKGATESEPKEITLKGDRYQIVQGCKPHDCASEQLVVMYSKDKKVMAGVFSKLNENKNKQELTWFNINDNLSIDGKTVLFAAITGSLDNHPNAFNYN
ncbi:Ivy family C-type lysozyme inhibitor [Proteus myxofaciens]|uniref:Inhibitor of vertebrate lysozyme n=1 Tax=Proteus myxofaciens ATCC 19692 TaxID=1354337 RepID=A0A198F1N6_9GAMM|nr:Ivy family C-type lysozyme inhibitor [Proteus myxofaciens]OAT18259.1 inhibitor of vertebrate lysozyme [Proteus myxofaciens ATCC 19692]